MDQLDKLKVALDIEGQIYEVGTLAKDGRQIYFKYDDEFLKYFQHKAINVSSIKKP